MKVLEADWNGAASQSPREEKSFKEKPTQEKSVLQTLGGGEPKEMWLSRAPLGTLRTLILIKGYWGTEKAEG